MNKESIMDKINQIKSELSQLANSIRTLPTNPNVEKLGHNCFSIKSSEIFKHDKWSPNYYNFEYQYNFIAELVETLPIDQVIEKLYRICNKKSYYHKSNTIQFHPDVIQNLKTIIKKEELDYE
jgi:hypothetical protein